MSRYIRRVIKDIQQDVTLNGTSVVISDTHMIDGHEVAPFVPGTVDGISGSDVTGEVNIGYDDINPYPVNDGPNQGSPGEPPYSYDVAAPAHESVMIATIKVHQREAIRDYSQSNLEYLESTGADVYALFDDGTERKVTWPEVFDPKKPTKTITINVARLANAANQHFWTDDNGAHVTSDLRRSWEDEYEEPDHGTLATPTLQNPWHNILLNSLGILLRKGLINLASIESGSIAFYDGQGNNSSNINAVFGSQGAQIGKDTDNHLILDNTGLNAYDSQGNLIPVHASNIQADHADIEDLKANKADISTLTSGYARIQDLTAAQGKINNLTTFILQSVRADIDNLTADEIEATDISALNASLSNLEAGSATVQDLETINAFVEMLAASRITTNYLMANYADIDLANVDTEWLNHGVIREASISDAMIQGISANKLTAGEIDASKIIVSNLLANNIIVNSINNVPVTGATVADALRYHDEDINNLNDRLNYELQLLNDRIDSQIETFTLQDVPTLNNYPYNEWLVYLTDSNNEEVLDSDNSPIQTEDLRPSHIGDIAYVSNPSNEADGYSYRFAYDNTTQTYNWVLIKDNQITAVLQRLIDAEGKIDNLETFESTTSAWKTETDQGITTIRNNITTLTGNLETANQAISTKVDTNTFQTIVDEVNEQSSTITTLSTTVDTLSDNVESSVSTVTSLVNSVKQTADNNSAVIKGLETTTSDLYGISDTINERVSSLNQSLNGFNTTVSNIYSDITDTNKALNQLRATYVVSHTAGNVSAKTADSIVSYLIDSNGEYILDSNNNRIELYDSLGSFILKQGNRISCTFENGNTSTNPTLNINNTGARPILSYNGEALSEDEINWKPNSTFEFVYDGNGWKLQDAGSIKRLSTAETQIDQNARAIELRATTSEVSEAIANIQVGGRNLAMVKDQILTPTDYSALTMYISSPLIANETYLLQLWDVNIAHSGKQNSAINLAVYYCGGSVQLVRFTSEQFDSGHADYILVRIIPTSAMVSNSDVNNAGDTKFIRFYNSVPNASGVKSLTISRVKLEKGTKPTDWTPAPEDMQTIEKAAADFKVTSEAISSRVEKTDYTGNTLVSMINQTADEVKIQAKHVEIDGMAVFSNRDFSENLNNKLGSISSYAESIGTDLANYIASNESTLNSLNSLLQNQKDNQVDVWYYAATPTLSGPPYNGWLYLTDSNGENVLDSANKPISVEDTRQSHVGDIYFNTSTGYMYRFVNSSGFYEWVRIRDNDISSSLIRQQRIYYRTKSDTRPSTPSAWVTKTVDSFSTNSTTMTNWTTKFSPQYQNDTKYAYMWTCLQSQTVSGSITYSDVLIDDTETVIDGGNIVTATIKANKLDIDDINVAKSLTVGAFTDSTKEDISNSTYITKIDDNGIKIHAKNNTDINYVQLNAESMRVHHNGTKVAEFGEAITLGYSGDYVSINSDCMTVYKDYMRVAEFGDTVLLGSPYAHATRINTDGMQVFKGGRQVASFGDTILLGSIDTDTSGTQINTNGMQVYKGGNQVASFGDTILLGSASSQGTRINSSGMQVFKGGSQVASFGNSITIGKSNSMNVNISTKSLTFKDRNNYEFFKINDMRDDNGRSYITDTFIGDGETDIFYLSYTSDLVNNLQVTIDDYPKQRTTDYVYQNGYIMFNTTPATSSVIKATYYTTTGSLYFTFGDRDSSNSTYGPYSVSLGSHNIADSPFTFSQGYHCKATSAHAIAMGMDTNAKGRSSIAIGDLCESTRDYSITIGIGSTNKTMHGIVIGSGNETSNKGTIAIGRNLSAYNEGMVAIGESNADNIANCLFAIGNGASGLKDENGNYYGVRVNTFTITGTKGNLSDIHAYIGGRNSSMGSSVTSDKRIKKHIDYISYESSSNFIKQLKPRHFLKNGTEDYGFYAQEVEEIDEYGHVLVTKDNSGVYDLPDFRLLNYEGFIAPIVSTIQGMLKSIEDLQQENEQLKQKNQELENRLARLEAILLKDG